jgi:hypothetical protein
MTRTTLKLAFIFSCFAGLASLGCAAETRANDVAASEAALVQQTRLDRVTPAEVAATFAAGLKPDFEACIAAHPAITEINAATIAGFYQIGVTSHYGVREVLEGMLAEPGITAVPVSRLLAEIEPWATRTLSRHQDAEGYYSPPSSGVLSFYYAEQATREEKAFSLAAKPGGKDLREIRAQWKKVQGVHGNLDSFWLNPVKVSGDDPGLGEIRQAMKFPRGIEYMSWGNQAVDDFYTAHEGPAEAAEFDPISTFVKSSAIKKRWYFYGVGDAWSHNYLVVLDEHNQLWGMSMGYSE